MLERRIETTREAFRQVFGGRARMRILLESGTESEWVAQHVEGLGHAVVVADPNYAPMYGGRSRKVKTDRAVARAQRQTLRLRRQVVRMRSGLIFAFIASSRETSLRLRVRPVATVRRSDESTDRSA